MVKNRAGKPIGQRPSAAAIAAQFERAVAHHQRGDLVAAEAAYRELLAQVPWHFDALHLLGIARMQRGGHGEAVDLIRKAIDVDPRNPNKAAALSNLGIALYESGRAAEALGCFERSLALAPRNAETIYNLGNARLALRDYDEALACYDRALALKPDYVAALNNRGNALAALRRTQDALASFDRAIAISPDLADAHSNRADVLLTLQRPDEALASADRALRSRPGFADAINSRGNALRALKRYDEAARAFGELAGAGPRFDHALGELVDCELRACDWTHLADHAARVGAAISEGRCAALPWEFLGVSGSGSAQLACARAFVAERYPASTAPLWRGERYRHDRSRIAYLSADFHEHATAHLMAGLFEAHDAARFEITAVSFGPETNDPMRARLRRAFPRFLDVRERGDRDIARTLRELEVDIAVDLKGFTANSRTGIFAFRAAPLQVNYLGYPGTMGAPYIDYIIADRFVIPRDRESHYTEKVVRLPDVYQVNDAQRRIAEATPTRAQAGLPESGFVFCCFNSNYKITPEMFAIWMRLLERVPGSVLWLLEANALAQQNLRREAQRRGVAPERLVFAPTLPADEHLARHRLADLFLDTRPVNAHTTASDALWAGLPLVTCTDDAFASRVAASLLHAVGLPELVADDPQEYEAIALRVATTPTLAAELRARLAQNRGTHPLFDTDRHRRHLEAAYTTIWDRHQHALAPEGFDVELSA
ncbi:MAG TPA: tetratricopeptide repeat protein [Casimicrobiaceae bacterium]|nr:tetratricopeptide repeat protein [Casimicrobiaceae bacterium]